jgi:uncharacterized protein YggE
MTSTRQSSAPGGEHITVVGEGRIEVATEVVEVSLAVQHTAETPAAAKAHVDERCTRIIEIARALDIDPQDVRASELALSPHREYRDDQYRAAGYSANRRVQIKMRRLGHFNTLLDRLVDVPVDRIERISTSLADPATAEQACLTRAIDDAKQKAASIARQFNVRLGRVYSVAALPRDDDHWMRAGSGLGTAGDAAFEPGLIAIEARIEATFHLDRTTNY